MSLDETQDPGARVRALSEYGLRLTEVDSNIPATRYFRSGKELLRMADVYEEEGELEKAFILYSKFTTLFVEKLPNHPDYKNVPAKEKANCKKLLQVVFPKAMAIKTKLTARYTLEEAAKLEEQRQIKERNDKLLEQQRIENEKKSLEETRRREELQARMLQETEDQLQQLKLKEQSRIDSIKRSAAGITTVTVSGDTGQRPTGFGSTTITPSTSTPSAPSPPPDVSPPPYSSTVSIPGVPNRSLKPATAPSFTIPPSVNRSAKPSSIDHFTSVGESGLKPIHVPEELVPLFLHRALLNTSRSIETCGILCGKLKSSRWYITHLLIPQQSGTTDSCDIMNEEALVDFQDKHNLVTLGWIHTHPTQTAFLSSVDQHTHWPYQKLLPEAIAIVCSPKFNETGYFYLTPDYGMEFVQNCTGRGFHEHPSHRPLFEASPHVQVDQYSKIAITDLRMHNS